MRNWSASTSATARGVHQPLEAKVLVMAVAGTSPLGLVAMDLGWWMGPDDEALLRRSLAEAGGFEPERLILHVTHTHAGPSLSRSDAERPGGHLIGPWLDRVTHDLASTVRSLVRDLRPGLLEWATGVCDLATVRDLPLADGSVVCGYNPAVPAPDRLVVGRVTDGGGRPRAVIAQYAAHPTSLGPDNDLLSPDYVGPARAVVESALGASLIFLQGPSGDLAPREQYAASPAIAEKNGRVLGHAILATLSRMVEPGLVVRHARTLQSGAPLGITELAPAERSDVVAARVVEIDLPTQDNEPPRTTEASVAEDRVQRAARVRAASSGAAYPITVWVLGSAVIVAHPGEAYYELQTLVAEQVAGALVMVVNLANGAHRGYLPPAHAYQDQRYQSWQTPLAQGSLEIVAESLAATLSRMIPEPLIRTERQAPRTTGRKGTR